MITPYPDQIDFTNKIVGIVDFFRYITGSYLGTFFDRSRVLSVNILLV